MKIEIDTLNQLFTVISQIVGNLGDQLMPGDPKIKISVCIRTTVYLLNLMIPLWTNVHQVG
jgi:hypothetical protein